MLNKENIVKAFSSWGFKLNSTSNGQHIGDCPFCRKENKFYINEKNGLWDCKVCCISGNYVRFLDIISKKAKEQITKEEYSKLSLDRKLPIESFKPFNIGFFNGNYTLPIYGIDGKIQDLRRYKIGKKLNASVGCSIGLLNLNQLQDTKEEIIYLCEGEWDGVALSWLLRKLGKRGLVVAVPGANTFKFEWIQLFQNKTVYCCYDNDEAGISGEDIVHKKLAGAVKSIQFIHWPEGLPKGYDIRDIVSQKAYSGGKPKKTFKRIMGLFKNLPRKQTLPTDVIISQSNENVEIEEVSIEEVFKIFKKWLFLKNTDGIEIMLSTVIANKIQGDPIWMFLVAPPGSAKTEIIQSLNTCEFVYSASSLTPHSLISGANWAGGKDPSLIPHINTKVLSVKDFTTIMEMRDNERDEIFSILRDAYDGYCSKVFGNGIRRTYESKFGIIAGVTPVIYHLDAQSQSLGERFLKFTIENNLKHSSEDQIIDKAIGNINKETSMRTEIAEVVGKFIRYRYHKMGSLETENLPTIPDDIKEDIVALVKFGARMRGTVSRDKYRPEMINARPSSETGSRLGKQLAKLAQAIAIVNGRKVVTKHEYELVKKCMIDTVSQKTEDVIRCLYEVCPSEKDAVPTKTVSAKTKYPQSTVVRTLQDLTMLELVKRFGKPTSPQWTLSDYSRDLITKAKIYTTTKQQPKKKIKVII